jgi:hypothetical protein
VQMVTPRAPLRARASCLRARACKSRNCFVRHGVRRTSWVRWACGATTSSR